MNSPFAFTSSVQAGAGESGSQIDISPAGETPPSSPRVTAVVVTYNRLELLKECLAAIEAQSYGVDRVVVVDNASSDGTATFLETCVTPKTRVERLHRNLGGAGGFAHGIDVAGGLAADFVWLMDDDCVPEIQALETLIEAGRIFDEAKEPYSFLCSRVVDTFGAACNHPVPSSKPNSSGWPQWAEYAQRGCILVDECTFVSVLVPMSYVRRVGLPFSEMFIWGDDTEYTRRLSSHAPGVYVAASQVLHKRLMRGGLSIHNETSPTRLRFYRFFYRNRLYVYRNYLSPARYVSLLLRFSWDFMRLCGKGKFRRASIVARGVIEGLFFSPKLQVLDTQTASDDLAETREASGT